MAAAEPFSTLLRTATREQHERAEGSGFVTALTTGRLPAEAYAALAGQLWHVYSALEEAAPALRTSPVVGPLLHDELRRLPALESDLAELLGPRWAGHVVPMDAASRYARRIRAVAERWPPGYLAHHYTRYLGDLSGGQIMRRALQRSYGLPDSALRFFAFDGIPKPKPFKDRYRALLDAAPLSPSDRDRVVAEARLAFDLNTEVFASLGAVFLDGAGRPAGATLAS